ncbi:MAG: hypothetical protein K9K63_17245 [Desulfotignum sp.]|nr:hypothetical protein [Desulfotignum sp.]MCF8090428.1 hypothetical protein [Desulfotignum sp.]MCF8139053.1 hypothetical protein [Desulfotignum sp.]
MTRKIFVSDKEEMRERLGFVSAAGFFILILISVSFLSFRDMNKRIISDIDSRLLVGAVTIKNLLPRDFHDQATGPGVISPEQDITNIDVLSEFANKVDFKFLYTLIKKNNQIYITSSSATQEELDNHEQVRYFTLFDEADPKFHKVFDGNTPVSFTHEDRWGTFRALALPETSPGGIKYLSVAEFDISYLKDVLKSKLIETVIISVLLVFGMLPLFYLFIRRGRRITEIHKKMEKQLQQAQKMESIGRLAGGVAHDYNNISSIIIGYSELALEKAGRDVSLHEDLLEIHKAAKRSTEITRQLLAFARKQTIAPTVLDVNVAVESMLKMLRRLIGEDIKLSWHPGEKIQPIKIDPSQVDQILANLCVNSRDAIKDVGKIDIETKNISFDEQYCAAHAGFVPGDYVMISVSDDGSGIASEKMDEIFEPFFTTKVAGKGTGLGLATVYGIVKQNSGFINVYSESEKGATFKIYLPVHAGSLKPFSKNDLAIKIRETLDLDVDE